MADLPATPSKPRTKWLKLFSQYQPTQDEVPPHVAWFWRYSERIDRDPAFIQWWSGTPTKKLYLHLSPARTHRHHVAPHTDGLYLAAGVPDATALLEAELPELDENDNEVGDRSSISTCPPSRTPSPAPARNSAWAHHHPCHPEPEQTQTPQGSRSGARATITGCPRRGGSRSRPSPPICQRRAMPASTR